MNVFIVEDEPLAVQKLSKLLRDVAPDIEISGTADGIESSVEWLQANPEPDLILMDIELCDGQSFEIFNQMEVKSPVIFTTSYDEYAIQAFRVNSVDYLLKPIKREDLERALQKYEHFNNTQNQTIDITKLVSELQRQNQTHEYRARFLVKQGQRLTPVETAEIAYFYEENGLTFFMTRDRIKHLVDYNLEQLEHILDPKLFFRVNGQFILDIKSVGSVHNNFNGKLSLSLKPMIDKEVIVSKERVSGFKNWMGR